MKVGFMASGADGGRSGIAQYEINLVRELRKIGVDLELHLFVNRNHAAPFEETFDTVRCHRASGILSRPLPSVAWHQTVLPAAAKCAGLDILHLSSHQRLTFLKGCPTVGTIHDLGGFVIKGKYAPSRMLYLKRVVPILARRLDRVITDSQFSRRDIERFIGIDGSKIDVIHLGYDSERFTLIDPEKARAAIRGRRRLPDRYFLYVARLEHPSKNHVMLVEAFARLKRRLDCPHKLVFVGSEWSGAAEIRERVGSRGLEDDVVFAGHVPGEELPPILAAAEAFVFPSLFEGFGIPPLEAMACGAPVICSNAACLPEVVGDAAWLLDPGQPEEWSEAMGRIIEEPARREELIRKGLERCGRFTWRNTARKTLQVYEKMTSN